MIPETDEWTFVTELPGPRAAHAMVAIDDQLYIIGGVGPSTQLWVYDIEADDWDLSRAEMPTLREHLTAVMLDGKLYVIGGRWRDNVGTLEVYDPEADEWTELTQMSTPRGGLTAAVLAGRIHVTGGEAFSPLVTFAEHEVYDPETDTWLVYPDMPTARHGLTSAAVDDVWYVIGGATGAAGRTTRTLTGAVEIFTPASP